jgi:chromosome segregation ATPase
MSQRPGRVPDNVPLLVPTHGPGEHRLRVLDCDASTIGRARGCDLCLQASDVSTLHCILYRGARGYFIRDCHSRTGTRVNGEVVREPTQLVEGDILQVGPFSFEVHLPRQTPTPDAAPADASALERREASRRRLAGHALRLRRLLRECTTGDTTAREAELKHERAWLIESRGVYERRLHDFNEAERELDEEREKFRARVQQVESEMAQRLEQVDQQVHERWQEFQRRCQAEEVQRMKQQLDNGPAEAHAALEPQRAALTQQETTLRAQRAELARMLNELRSLQEELRRPIDAQLQTANEENDRLRKAAAELQALVLSGGGNGRDLKEARAENELLRMLLQDRERELADVMEQLSAAPEPTAAAAEADLEALRAENALLKEELSKQDAVVTELRRVPKTPNELESYEAELNQDRQQLENDRAKLMKELEHLRMRNEELDEATREMEMELSRERAELGRERIRMERMREELKQDTEKLQREISVRESLASVHRLREEMTQKKPGAGKADPAADRLRQLRSNDTPRG